MKAVLALARQTLAWAWTQRLPLWALGLGVLMLAAGFFFGAVSFAGQQQAVLISAAALLRVALAVLVAVTAVAVVQADIAERWLDLLQGGGLARWQWLLGRALACAALAVLLSLAAGLPLAAWSMRGAALPWLVGLSLEMLVVACAAVAAALSLPGLAVPVVAVLGYWALARSMSALVALTAWGAQDAGALAQAAQLLVGGLSWLVPRLDDVAPGGWLTGNPIDAGSALRAGAQALVWGVLLTLVALADALRRRF